MSKHLGAVTNSRASGVSWVLGAWKNIWKQSRFSSIWTRLQLGGTKHGDHTDSHGSSRTTLAGATRAARGGGSARALQCHADFYGFGGRRDAGRRGRKSLPRFRGRHRVP